MCDVLRERPREPREERGRARPVFSAGLSEVVVLAFRSFRFGERTTAPTVLRGDLSECAARRPLRPLRGGCPSSLYSFQISSKSTTGWGEALGLSLNVAA